MNKVEKKFYNEVQSDIKDFARYTIEGVKNTRDIEFSEVKNEILALRELNLSNSNLEVIKKIIENAIQGAVHSIFVSIDGGTALSDNGKAIELIDLKTGKSITEGALHENFMDVLD